jgi:hypothetical protein
MYDGIQPVQGSGTMGKRKLARLAIFLILFSLNMTPPLPAQADGGPILSDPEMWASFKETEQVAIVVLGDGNSAHIDLFVSMRNEGDEPQRVTFFIPIGVVSSNFTVAEKTSFQFDQALTEELDQILEREAKRISDYRQSVRASLLLGSLLVNGGWSWPLWLPFILSSCATAPAPIATYETESSAIAIYDLERDVDLQALIDTTGLDPAVTETLSRYQGQQIAIVELQTEPWAVEGGTYGTPVSQAGIHLSWDAELAPNENGMAYSYPLGTGGAWSHPIEITRVYVVAPPGIDFDTQYPSLGEDLSGFTGGLFSQRIPRILYAYDPAFAIEDVVGDFGRVWRATYVRSSSIEDIVITRLDELSSKTQAFLRLNRFHEVVRSITWLLSLILSALLWVSAWRFIMSRNLGVEYAWRDLRLWRESLGWAVLYPLTNLAAVVLTVALAAFATGLMLIVGIPLLITTALGLVTAFTFGRTRSHKLGVTRTSAEFAYVAVVLLTNAIYIPLAVAYAAFVGVL